MTAFNLATELYVASQTARTRWPLTATATDAPLAAALSALEQVAHADPTDLDTLIPAVRTAAAGCIGGAQRLLDGATREGERWTPTNQILFRRHQRAQHPSTTRTLWLASAAANCREAATSENRALAGRALIDALDDLMWFLAWVGVADYQHTS